MKNYSFFKITNSCFKIKNIIFEEKLRDRVLHIAATYILLSNFLESRATFYLSFYSITILRTGITIKTDNVFTKFIGSFHQVLGQKFKVVPRRQSE